MPTSRKRQSLVLKERRRNQSRGKRLAKRKKLKVDTTRHHNDLLAALAREQQLGNTGGEHA